MKRKANIYALLDRSDRDIEALKKEYGESLTAQAVSQELKIDIKNLCGNLRSVLDYFAADVREVACPSANTKDRFYFPVLPGQADFIAQTSTWFPGLKSTYPRVCSFLESVQPYQAGWEWLGQFNRVNNDNKHGDLVEQTRVETPRAVVTSPGGSAVSWDPRAVSFGSGVYVGGVPVNLATQLPVPHPAQKVENLIWVDFRFRDPDVSVLQLLEQALSGVREIADGLVALL